MQGRPCTQSPAAPRWRTPHVAETLLRPPVQRDAGKQRSGHPGIKLGELLKKVLKQHVEQKDRAPKVTAASKVRTDTRYIPRAVKHAVYSRDQGQCTYEAQDGKRCSCKTNLEFDHIKPLCQVGSNSAENLRLRCGPHNRLQAERILGKDFMLKQYAAETIQASPP